MSQTGEEALFSVLDKDVDIHLVESGIYSVLPDTDSGSSYDKSFGNAYDWVACNFLYNWIIWGYSTKRFDVLTRELLESDDKGIVLDVGCGSLAFAARAYAAFRGRPVILLDQSIKLLKIAKARLIKYNGQIPNNLIFLQADAMALPFKPHIFTTIISLNLLHVLDDFSPFLAGIKNILTDDSIMLFTTLVKNNRLADRYLQVWENAGELVSRDILSIERVFRQNRITIEFEIKGNMAYIYFNIIRI